MVLITVIFYPGDYVFNTVEDAEFKAQLLNTASSSRIGDQVDFGNPHVTTRKFKTSFAFTPRTR